MDDIITSTRLNRRRAEKKRTWFGITTDDGSVPLRIHDGPCLACAERARGMCGRCQAHATCLFITARPERSVTRKSAGRLWQGLEAKAKHWARDWKDLAVRPQRERPGWARADGREWAAI